jgi:DNA replication protein DnaC
MRKLQVQKNNPPDLKRPTFNVDGQLSEKLNAYPITSLLNKSTFTCFLGRPGSGKTSLLTAFLKTPELFHKVYNHIYVFMPAGSRTSMKDNFFEKYIHPTQLYDELTLANLEDCYEKVQDNAENNETSLIILDDVQKALRDTGIRKLFLSAVNNRRHGKLSIWLAAQNYKSVEPSVRNGLTDIFVFKINKSEMQSIYEEHVEQHQDLFLDILKLCFKEPHSFMYINTNTQRIFSNWDEVVIPED